MEPPTPTLPQQPQQRERTIDVEMHMKGFQLVKLEKLYRFVEYLRISPSSMVEDKGIPYLNELQNSMIECSPQQPLELAVSKKTKRAYLFERN